jgi:hypothetical protein
MSLKNRLVKLERIARPEIPPLILIQTEGGWTADQLQQMSEVEKQGGMVVRVVFVDGKKYDDI